MLSAIPIAVLTNAARVTATGVLTYYYGKQATESTLHDVSGWLVYVVALVLLIAGNVILKFISRKAAKPQSNIEEKEFEVKDQKPKTETKNQSQLIY